VGLRAIVAALWAISRNLWVIDRLFEEFGVIKGYF